MAQLSQLMLFDPDPRGLDTLTYGFEREGCAVTGTVDLTKARHLIQQTPPPLLIVNLRDSEKVGIDLVRSTTANPRTRNLPCVVIGRNEHRADALAAGAFAFLSVPLFVRDVIGVCRMVAAASVPGSRPSPEAELSLGLTDVDGIYFLLRALAVTGRSALVEVRHGTSRGELRFIQGTLTSADVGAVQGLPALHRMLLWEDATLHFKFKNVVRRGTQLSMKSSEILEECDRFLRDFSHEAKELGFARTYFSADLERMQPSEALPSEVLPVLKLFDGTRDLAQILDESPFRIFDTLKIVKRFLADGAIKVKTSVTASVADVAAGSSGPGALDFWLQRQSPALGAELGGTRGPQNGSSSIHSLPVGGAGSAVEGAVRVVSPFVVTGGTAADKAVGGIARKRTITKKNVSEAPTAMDDVITPPPVSRPSETPTRRTAAVARGEIKIARATGPRQHEAVPSAGGLSVVIEPSVLPAAVPLASLAPPPVTAQPAPPSVIVAPMSVILDPSASIPTPLATPALGQIDRQAKIQVGNNSPAARNAATESPARVVAENFNDVEADFFEREADLYKRESIETFDDLDGANHPNGRPRRR